MPQVDREVGQSGLDIGLCRKLSFGMHLEDDLPLA